MFAVVEHLNIDLNGCEFKILGNGGFRFSTNCDTTKINTQVIQKLKTSIGHIEIDKNNDLVLLSMSRFIDNGYGLAWIEDDKIDKIITERRYRVNGLEITSIVKIKENWYYISFT